MRRLLRAAGSAPATALWLILAWLAATAWARPLTLPDEGRYVGVAWEMMVSGDWLTPTLDGLPFFHKPPLLYWLTAGSMTLFGASQWTARLAPLLGASAGAWALYLFARRWFSAQAARATLLVLLTQPLWFIGGQFANHDMLVAGCISVTVLLLAHAVLSAEQGRPYRSALAGAWAAAALGVLAKGLIGFVLPGLVLLAWLLATRRLRRATLLLWWPGMLLFLLLAAPWFVAMQLRFPQFLDYFFVVQQFKRFSQGGFNNAQPFWFYPGVLALLGLPWFVWVVRLRSAAYWRDAQLGAVRALMACWLLVIVGFFSLPQSKLVGYILPAVPPLSLLIADAAAASVKRSARALRLWRGSVALALAICLGAIVVLSLRQGHSHRDLAATLKKQRAAGEAVVFIGEYFYDLPFYARLRQHVHVVDDWASPEVPLRDNWRKELFDAGTFAPRTAAATLLTPDRLPHWLCSAGRSWLVTPADATAARHPVLRAAEVVQRSPRAVLWVVDARVPAAASALGCGPLQDEGVRRPRATAVDQLGSGPASTRSGRGDGG